jgi:hypothetical protein
MANVPIIDDVSETATTMKVRHPGRSDPFGLKARKGLRHAYILTGKRPLHRHPIKTHGAAHANAQRKKR